MWLNGCLHYLHMRSSLGRFLSDFHDRIVVVVPDTGDAVLTYN